MSAQSRKIVFFEEKVGNWILQDQENYGKDEKDDDEPFSNRPCDSADKSQDNEYYSNNEAQDSQS